MLNFDFIEKELEIVSLPPFVYDFSRKIFSSYILLNDQISLPDCICVLRYCLICVLQLFVNQAVASKILKLILSF